MKNLLIFCMLGLLTACAYVDPSITDQTKIYYDSPVRRSTLQVSVHPRSKQPRPLTAYFAPFVVQQPNSDYRHLGDAFGTIFHNVWTEERLFPIQEFDAGTSYQGLQVSLERARRRGADLLILGKVPYFYAGHTVDDTAITIQLDIYAAGSGTLLWTMMQSGRIEDKFPDDYIYFRHVYRLSEGPFNKIIRSIARDMAVPLKSWLPSPDTHFRFAETPQAIEQQLETPTVAPDPEPAEMDIPDDADETRPEPVARPMEKGVSLNIQFDFDKATIRPESTKTLDALGEALNMDELKGKRIIIAGHTDTKGSSEYNLRLSRQRADSVKQFLVNKWGIDPALVETVGYGKSMPITEGATPEDMQRNRRVEVRVVD